MTEHSPDAKRARARELAAEHGARGDHLGWFEALYREAREQRAVVPWADLEPNQHLVAWHRRAGIDLGGRRCLKVGCGLGDDAEYLAAAGGAVTAFDISDSAIAWCRARFPASRVRYVTADLLSPPAAWRRAFDLVLESYTLQVLPAALRGPALERVADFVAPGGTLLLICRGREPGDPEGAMPWPLTREELRRAEASGLTEVSFEDFPDDETPPVRRFRVELRRDA